MAARFKGIYEAESMRGTGMTWEYTQTTIAETLSEAEAELRQYRGGSNVFCSFRYAIQDYENPPSPAEEKAYYDKKKSEAEARKREEEARIRREKEVKEAADKKVREENEMLEKLREAAAQGDANAQYELALLYFAGKGEMQYPKGILIAGFCNLTNYFEEASKLIHKAAAQGHKQAKDYLAREEERKVREAKEAKKERFRKTGRKISAILAVASVVISIVGGAIADDDGGMLTLAIMMPVVFIITFLVVFFAEGKGKKITCLILGVLLPGLTMMMVVAMFIALATGESVGVSIISLVFMFGSSIGLIMSYILAMICPRY